MTGFGQGKSDEIQLLNGGRGQFERNGRDTYELTCDDIGEPTKLRIGHNNKGWGAGWLLNGVEVTSQRHSGKTFSFPCGKECLVFLFVLRLMVVEQVAGWPMTKTTNSVCANWRPLPTDCRRSRASSTKWM